MNDSCVSCGRGRGAGVLLTHAQRGGRGGDLFEGGAGVLLVTQLPQEHGDACSSRRGECSSQRERRPPLRARTLRQRVVRPLHHALVQLPELAELKGRRDLLPHKGGAGRGAGERGGWRREGEAGAGRTWKCDMFGKSPCGRRCFFMTA